MEAPTVLIPLRGGVRWEQRGHHSARHTGGPWQWEEWLGSQLTQTTQKKVRSEQGTSLVIQWLRLCLPMQDVHVWSLVGQVRSPHTSAKKPKTWNRSNIVTNLIQNLKMAHLQKPLKKKKKEVSKGFRYSFKSVSRKAACSLRKRGGLREGVFKLKSSCGTILYKFQVYYILTI